MSRTLNGQLGKGVTGDILAALSEQRGDRCGRFWVDLQKRKVTMAIGESAQNKYKTADF